MISNKPNILYILHNFKANDAGTTLHVKDLISNMNDIFNFHVFSIEGSTYKVYSYIDNKEYVTVYPRTLYNATFYIYKDNDYKDLLESIISDFSISFVHIEHTYGGHFFDIGEVCKEKNIKYAITLHDYYSICPLVNKLYCGKKYCGLKPSKETCEKCTKKMIDKNFSIKEWRLHFHDLLKNAEYVIVPSLATKQEINEIYDDIKIIVIEHGLDVEKEKSLLSLDKTNNIAFVGFIMPRKGSDVLKYLVNKKERKFNIHLFGFTNVLLFNSKNYINHGPYKREDLTKLLNDNNIKLNCLLSICPETFSYTLSESVCAGVPVLAYNIGALRQRIEDDNLGWLIDINASKEEVFNYINKILSNNDEYQKKIESINKYKVKTIKEMTDEYLKIYKKEAINKELDLDKLINKANESKKYLKVKTIYDNKYLNAGVGMFFNKLPSNLKMSLIKHKKEKMIKRFKNC